MARQGRRSLLDTLFPRGDAKKKTSEMIDRGLDALRAARDERALSAGAATLVPSRLELRLPQIRYDELAEMGAVRDIEYFFNDELMKDLSSDRLRTFGDHPVYITIAADTSLQPNEIYAAILRPDDGKEEEYDIPAGRHAAPDRTSVLGEAPPAAPSVGLLRIIVKGNGKVRERVLEGRRWIIGRQGSSGRTLPEGFIKVDLDLPPTVSREQARIDLIADDRMRVERIGKAPMLLGGGESLPEGESRLLPVGATFSIDDHQITICR
ncbi:MAG: hypothetical protein JWQ98_389 [Chlorobi bacterium]|nr:hypothetical protein [Chlorobiota bacterium]